MSQLVPVTRVNRIDIPGAIVMSFTLLHVYTSVIVIGPTVRNGTTNGPQLVKISIFDYISCINFRLYLLKITKVHHILS